MSSETESTVRLEAAPSPPGLRARVCSATAGIPEDCRAVMSLILDAYETQARRESLSIEKQNKRLAALERIAEPISWAANIIGYCIVASVVGGAITAVIWLVRVIGAVSPPPGAQP